MLVRDYFEVPMSVDAVVARLADESTWRNVLAGALEPNERRLLMRYRTDSVFPLPAQPFSICVAEPRRYPRGTVVDVAWALGPGPHLGPVMRGDLACAALGPEWTHVEFTGSLATDPASSEPADRLARQRAGDYAVRLLLTRMVAELRTPATSGSRTAS